MDVVGNIEPVTVRTRAQDKDRLGRCDIVVDAHFVDGRVGRWGREAGSQTGTGKSAVHPVGVDMPEPFVGFHSATIRTTTSNA